MANVIETKSKKHYLALIACCYIAVALISIIKGDFSLNPIFLGEFLGRGLGVAFFALIAMAIFNNATGWVVFVIFLLGYSVDQLKWL